MPAAARSLYVWMLELAGRRLVVACCATVVLIGLVGPIPTRDPGSGGAGPVPLMILFGLGTLSVGLLLFVETARRMATSRARQAAIAILGAGAVYAIAVQVRWGFDIVPALARAANAMAIQMIGAAAVLILVRFAWKQRDAR